MNLFISESVKHRLWTTPEKKAVLTHLGQQIRKGRVPGKNECESCIMNANGALDSRGWKAVKLFVKNQIDKFDKRKIISRIILSNCFSLTASYMQRRSIYILCLLFIFVIYKVSKFPRFLMGERWFYFAYLIRLCLLSTKIRTGSIVVAVQN